MVPGGYVTPNEHSTTPSEIVERARVIALVGASPEPYRASNAVMRFLLEHGYQVIPVRPGVDEILGCTCVAGLDEIEGPVDIVNVFRESSAAPDLARQAAACGAKTIWLQEGVRSDEARAIAEEAGLSFVENTCIKKVLLGGA
jgi:hypothetical protein